MTRIGIAVVEHADCFLVGVRGDDTVLAGHDEFPGGKCHPAESPSDCAVRECREETGIEVVAIRELMNVRHEYEHAIVDLHFWLCRPFDVATEVQNGFAWIPRSELPDRRFPEANRAVVESLINR